MGQIVLTFFLSLIFLFIRYSILAGVPYWYFWKKRKEKYQSLRIQGKFPPLKSIHNEIKWSAVTFLIFACIAVLVQQMNENHVTPFTNSFSDYSWGVFFISIVILVFSHDAYFYFAHRFMHLPFIYKHVHSVHHQSTNPSPFAAFSFHPLESLIEAAIIPMMSFVVPLNLISIVVFLTLSTIMNVIGHLGYELYPKSWKQSRFLKYMNSSTLHNCHHHYFHGNYGLYFNYWDRLFKTLKWPEDYEKPH